jgi:adenosine deaminase
MPRVLTPAERLFIVRMPKAELHVHIEGSVRPETLLELGRHYGIDYPFADLAGVRDWFRFRDFPHFIEVYIAIKQALRSVDDYARITREMAEDAARQGLHYLEVIFGPAVPGLAGATAQADVILAGLRDGACDARQRHGVQMQFICDPVRGRSPEAVLALARWCVDNLGDGLVGFGLGGVEVGHPPDLYADAFDLARRGGARLTLHAGETVGPESVWAALAVGSERIGHGVRSIEDPRLVAELAARQIVLEVSPTSNICLGVYPDYAAHPFRALHEAGVPVTVNSDDPPMFNTTLTDEYLVLAEQFDFTLDDLAAFSLRAVNAAFLPDDERAALADYFQAELDALRAELAPRPKTAGG